jgi:hypothetical protein
MFEVLGEAEVASTMTTEQQVEMNTTKEAAPFKTAEANNDDTVATESNSESDEDTLSYFAKLASS